MTDDEDGNNDIYDIEVTVIVIIATETKANAYQSSYDISNKDVERYRCPLQNIDLEFCHCVLILPGIGNNAQASV